MSQLVQVDRRPVECCNHAENLTRKDVAKDRYIEICKCGRKHYVMEVDPVALRYTATNV